MEHDLRKEIITTNQLLRQISHEIQQIKQLTQPSGKFDTNIKENASLMATLANMQQIDLENLPPLTRFHNMDVSNDGDQNVSMNVQNETESSDMDVSLSQ